MCSSDLVSKALQGAQARLTALKNQIQPADPEVVKVATDSVNALTRNLESVERELAKAEADVAAGVVAPEIKTQEAAPETPTPETGELFDREDQRQRYKQYSQQRKEAAAQLEEDFGAPIPDEVFEGDDADVAARLSESPFNWRAPRPTAPTPQKPPTKAKEKIEAPDESTEHVAETREGEKLEEFFNLIESNSD